MTSQDPEQRFRLGLALLESGKFADAAETFRAAIDADRRRGSLRPQTRFLSFYGLSRALAGRPSLEDLRLCQRAAETDSFDPTLQLNLGKVLLLAGKTTRALQAFERGLRLDPGDARLRAMLVRSDRRAEPVLRMLRRDHPLNRSLGRLRATLRGRASRTARAE